MRHLLTAVAGLALAFLLALLGARWLAGQFELLLPLWVWAGLIAALALLLVGRRLPPWWWPTVALLPFGILLLSDVSSLWFGLMALLLALVQWNAMRYRVPLYRSGAGVHRVVGDWAERHGARRIVDLGCGIGDMTRALGERFADRHIVGIESAPLNWLLARWRCRHLANVEIRLGNFWRHSLKDQDLAVCFLSPAPMARLWTKAASELPPGAALLSVEFEVPDRAAETTLKGADRPVHVYRFSSSNNASSDTSSLDTSSSQKGAA